MDLSSNMKPIAKNLGVTFDSDLTSEEQVMRAVQSCFLYSRNVSKIKSLYLMQTVRR